tara:strand:- start:346 stop:873 length:528 start_codon:yes stop_codon:yes gene_type:complete
MKNILNHENFKNYQIFKELNSSETEEFIKKMEINNYSKKEIIIKEGDEGNSILFLLNGELSISQALTLSTVKHSSIDNREKELIKLNSKNDDFSMGELALFNSDKKRSATVKAISNCKIARLDFKDFFKICNSNNSLGYKVMKNISEIITGHLTESNHKVLKLTTAFSLLINNEN